MSNTTLMSLMVNPAPDRAIVAAFDRNNEQRIPTTTLLPGGSQMSLLVRRVKEDRFLVSDDGAAIEELLSLGHLRLTRGDTRRANEIAERLGLSFDGAGFSIAEVSPGQLMAAVAYVAEAARQWASEVMLAADQRRARSISEAVGERLARIFPPKKIGRECEFLGASNKRHRFDFVVDLAGERHAVFEIVSAAPASLSAAHLKFFDLGQAHEDWPREAVAETLKDWAAEDVAVLSQVATHVRDLGSSWNDLKRYAA